MNDVLTASCNNSNSSNVWSQNGLPLEKIYNQKYDFILRRDEYNDKRNTQEKGNKHDIMRENKKINNSQGSGYSIGNQKKAYGIPVDLVATNETTLQMVWGPGTFGYSEDQLRELKASQVPLLNLSKVHFDTKNHGTPGGDNWVSNTDVYILYTTVYIYMYTHMTFVYNL